MAKAIDYACRALEAVFWLAVLGIWVVLAIVGAHFLVMLVTFCASFLYRVTA